MSPLNELLPPTKKMNPLSYIEKWIKEHGSASILRDHVALLKSEMEKFKTEVSDLKSERDRIKTQAEKVQAELDDARNEIKRLKQPKSSARAFKRELPETLRGLDEL